MDEIDDLHKAIEKCECFKYRLGLVQGVMLGFVLGLMVEYWIMRVYPG